MNTLVPPSLELLVAWALTGLERGGSVFGLPRRSFWVGRDGLDFSVPVVGGRADTPLGPAAGPHTQLAHNIVAAWLAGSRVIELKTVQALDRIEVPRPSIDAPAEGYNVEWSQELRLEDSLDQYLAAWCLVHVLAARGVAGPKLARDVVEGRGLAGTRFDASVGYDLAGIRSAEVARFLDGLTDARARLGALRERSRASLGDAADIAIPARVIDSVTLSTFHGCPAGEVERIVEHLFERHSVNVVIKLNPTLLGREAIEHLLVGQLGYTDLAVVPEAFASDLPWDETIALLERLSATARRRGLALGVKLTNTLVVRNPGRGLAGETVYLSGPPLHPIALALAERVERATQGRLPMSFSAGVCAENFADTVACGFAPVTTCTDLLRPTGYRRLPRYLKALAAEFERTDSRTLDAYRRARALGSGAGRDAPGEGIGAIDGHSGTPGLLAAYAARAALDPRYHAAPARHAPRARSPLRAIDCEACNGCTLACPNGAFYSIAAPPRRIVTWDLAIQGGAVIARESVFETRCDAQWLMFADWCNACGNCDTFCPEDGGPHRVKPKVYATRGAYAAAAPDDGVLIESSGERIAARFGGVEHRLERGPDGWSFGDGSIEVTLDVNLRPIAARVRQPREGHELPLSRAHILRLWVDGTRAGVNPVTALERMAKDAPSYLSSASA